MTQQRSSKQEGSSGPDQSRKKQLRRLALFAAAASPLLVALTLFAEYRQDKMSGASSRARKEHEHSAQAKTAPRLSEPALRRRTSQAAASGAASKSSLFRRRDRRA